MSRASERRGRTVDGTSEKCYVIMDKWARRLGLDHWDIRINFNLRGAVYAQVDTTDPEYEVATIWVNARLCRAELWNEAQFDQIILHEVVHIKLAKMTDLLPQTDEAAKLEESVVVGITEALLHAEEQGYDDPPDHVITTLPAIDISN